MLQRGYPTLLLGTAPANMNSLPAAAGRAGDAGHDMGPRMPCDIGQGRIQRLPKSEVKSRSVAADGVLLLRHDLSQRTVLF
eukprot:2650285-Heterocapsa_arctica.AAC.1